MNDDKTINQLEGDLRILGLPFMAEHHSQLAAKAARDSVGHLDYLAGLTEGELNLRRDRATLRRIKNARFPVVKTLDQFSWSWPKKINRMAIQNLFRLQFVEDRANVIFLGTVGLGKSHLATALGYTACMAGKSVLFSTAVDAINTLAAAQAASRLKAELKKYLAPSLLILDELGYRLVHQLHRLAGKKDQHRGKPRFGRKVRCRGNSYDDPDPERQPEFLPGL